MAPTTNSGLDFVAGAMAAGDDKERRDALAMNRQRQAQQDRMNAELHHSQIEENRAQGRRADAHAQLAMQPKLGKQAGPDLSAQITALIGQGYSKEEAASIVMKQWDPRLAAGAKPVANYEAEVANEIRKLDHERLLKDAVFAEEATSDDLALAQALLRVRDTTPPEATRPEVTPHTEEHR